MEFDFLSSLLNKGSENEMSSIVLKSFKQYDFENKDKIFRFHLLNRLRRTSRMFFWEGLPNNIKSNLLELKLQCTGFMCYHYFNKKDSKLANCPYESGYYISYCTIGGLLDPEYFPTRAIVNNPYLGFNKELTINKDCVLIMNDSLLLGLLPNINYYSSQETENDISLSILRINLRAMAILIAGDANAKKDIEEMMKDLKDGKLKTVVGDYNFMTKPIQCLDIASKGSSQNIIQLLEDKQYIKGSFWNDIGVQSNYNMKRETITSNENILNVDALLPLCDDMLDCRQQACKKIKDIFGQDYKVDFSSAWKKLRNDILLKDKEMEASIKIKSNPLDNKNDNIDKDEVKKDENNDK